MRLVAYKILPHASEVGSPAKSPMANSDTVQWKAFKKHSIQEEPWVKKFPITI